MYCRYWLVDCTDAVPVLPSFADQLFTRLLHVPFIAKFAVFACFSVDEMEMQLRVFCVTDDGLDKTLERYQNYHEMARTQHVHVRCIFL